MPVKGVDGIEKGRKNAIEVKSKESTPERQSYSAIPPLTLYYFSYLFCLLDGMLCHAITTNVTERICASSVGGWPAWRSGLGAGHKRESAWSWICNQVVQFHGTSTLNQTLCRLNCIESWSFNNYSYSTWGQVFSKSTLRKTCIWHCLLGQMDPRNEPTS